MWKKRMRHGHIVGVGMVLAFALVGCTMEDDTTESISTTTEEQALAETVLFGEAFDESAGDESVMDDVGVTADCVYVQWCKAPGSGDAVCRIRPGCKCGGAAYNECYADLAALGCTGHIYVKFPDCGDSRSRR